MAKSDLDKDSLKIGDYVVFNDVQLGVFLSVEGILLEDIVGIDNVSSLHDCIFCIHLQRQYSASRELNAFLEKYSMDVKNITEESELRYLQALERGMENENKLNDNYMRKKLGQVIGFGDVIQLFHVKSGKYLQFLPGKLAKDERENTRLGLDAYGSTSSWIQICPRFKIDKEGDRILSNVEVYLKVADRAAEYLHSAEREPATGQEREINCSLETTSWRLNIFQSSTDAVDKTLLMASQLVYIHDPETRANLALSLKKVETLSEDEEGSSDKVSAFIADAEDENDMRADDEPEEEEEKVVLRPSTTQYIDSNFLWILEASSVLVGGPVKWKTDQVRFKHLNTGAYLCQETKHALSEDGTTASKSWSYTTTADATLPGTLFSINELNSTAKFLCSGKASQIGHGSVMMERGPILPDSMYSYKVQGTKDKSAAVSLIVNYYFGHGIGSTDSDAAASSAVKKGKGEGDAEDEEVEDAGPAQKNSGQPLDVFAGLSARNYLEKYNNMTVLSTSANTIWPTGNRTDMEMFKMIVSKTVIFTQGFPISATNVKIGIDKSDPELRRRRQNLLREQNTLEIVLRLINKLKALSETPVGASRPTAANVDASFLAKMGRAVLEQCFMVLYNAIQDNQENQMYVADFMPVLLAHLNTQPMAVKCVTEMLSKNIDLQETKIGTREIQIFVDKLRSSKMNAMYLQLLQACCSCQGAGVDGNQCKVANMLFDGDTSDIIVTLEASYSKLTKVAWGGDKALYLTPPGGSEAKVIGVDLFLRGLPHLTLKWKRNGESISAPIGEIFAASAPAGMSSPLIQISSSMDELDEGGKAPMLAPQASFKHSNSFKARRDAAGGSDAFAKVAPYFVAELFLGAEMCMDRNYVAINKLKDLFTYEMLVTILAMESLSSSVKSAAVRLLMCLHVDRDPQAASKIPLLTRSWSDIKKNPEPQLPYVDSIRRYDFGLIQQTISEHIKGMSGRRWDELSRHMLKMLRTLVQFNFYGTNERMRDVIAPLIMALDRRGIDMATGTRSVGAGEVKAGASFSAADPSEFARNESFEESESQGKFGQGSFSADEDNISELSSQADLRFSIKSKERRERYQKVLDLLESPNVFRTMMLLVALDIAVDIYHLVAGGTFAVPSPIFLIQAATMVIFLIEIFVRTFCLYRVDGNFTGMYMDVYNVCDVVAVALTIAFLLQTPLMNAGAGFVIALRCVKVYRMMQLTGARIIAGDEEAVKLDGYKVTPRYSIAPIHELETMVEVVDILAFMQRLIEDRNISLAMHYFYAWENGTDRRSPPELFEQVVLDSRELSLSIADFDNIMLDVLMFVHMPLVQSTLEVLMAHHSMRKTLLKNVQQVQLLASSKREKQYREVNAMLQELEQNAETHELWGELETPEDHATNARTKEIIQKLIAICRVRHYVLEFDEDFQADVEIQDLYRNLGCFEICMKVMNLLESVEEDEYGNYSEVALNTRDLCLQCNDLLFWFLLGNPLNQEQGYGELKFFIDSLDDEINSHRVVGAIFKNNEALMRLVPHTHLDELVERILKNGKSHHYLALFACISNVGERNIAENQFQIVKILTSPGRLQNIACFFCPIDHPDYEEKRELMKPFLNSSQDLSLDDLPPLLAYHLMFLEVLSDCTVGKQNLTTVEAKVQSVFNYVDILQSILDPGTIIFTQIRLSLFFYNSIIEVELKIPGLEQSAYIWQLLDTYQFVLGYAKDELRQVEKAGWESPDVSRQKIEYIIVCILITGGFFARYYDPNTFRFSEAGANAPPSDKVQISLAQVNELIKSLFDKIKEIYDLDSPRLSEEMKGQIFEALESLNKSASKIIINNLVPTNNKLKVTTAPESLTAEAKLVQKFKSFHTAMTEDVKLMDKCENEGVSFIKILEGLPSIMDKVEADVRYETLIRKLVQHIRDNFQYVNGQKRLDARVTKTSTWIIRSFRTMIENKMGMTVYERDDDGGEEQDEKAAPVVNALNTCGATALCLDLIADGIDEGLQLEAIKLGVGLLFKEGGALEVQNLMHAHLSKTNSELFFKQVNMTLKKLESWHVWNETIILEEDQEPNLPDSILIVRFLQLMCEGHFLPNQDIMREQPNNLVSYNLLDGFVDYFECLSRIPCRTSTNAAIRVTATILEVIQGPCEGNQAYFALNTELIETLNRVNRAKMVHDCVEAEEVDLKKTSIDIFQGLLEGQGEKSVVYERVLSVIHLDIIQMMSKGTAMPEAVGKGGKLIMPGEPTEDQIVLQTECIVLLQMLCNFKPSLYDELGISKNIDDIVGSGTAVIEVIWRGDIHRRFFHVPNVCSFLAKSSMDALVENVDRSNSENKLIDFLARSHDLYREVKHQQLLTEKGVSHFFSLKVQDAATWITFVMACLINVLFIAYYNYSAGHARPTVTSATAITIINTFNIFQNVVGAFVILLNGVVRSPVLYQAHTAAGHDFWRASLLTASDPKTLYFCAYLVLSLLGLLAADYYLPFLLLDIVAKNATTRDVLNAVVIPRKQLGMTVVLAIFVTYIFAYFIFKYFRDDLGGLMGNGVYPGDNDCKNLWGCFKFVLCYGVRQGGGVGEMLKLSIGSRFLIDSTYYIVLIVMMLNIIFGIIIDTFSSLRANKNIRSVDTNTVCFVCGINDQVFDRASSEPDGFKNHIKLDHNMWNYLYFIFMLWEQDKDDDDGLEQYVRRAIDASEITWFPLNKAICLTQAATDEEITLRELSTEIHAFEAALAHKITHFQSEMSSMLDTVSQATKLEHVKGAVKDGIAGYIRKSMIAIATTEDGAEAGELSGGSAVLDTIDEDGGAGEEGGLDEGSTASGHGLGPVDEHEEDSDEDSDIENSVSRHTTKASTVDESNSMVGFAESARSEAPFPGSVKTLEINSVMAGTAVMIKDRSNKFWDMDLSSVPGTPSQPPALGDTLQAPSWVGHPGTVEEFPEDEHEAAEGTHSQKAGADLAGADGPVRMAEEQEANIPISDWNAPMTADGAEMRTSRPATESEDVRPDTAAPDAMVADVEEVDLPEGERLVGNDTQDAGFEPAPVEEDLAVLPVTESAPSLAEIDPAQLDEPSDVVMLSEETAATGESQEIAGAEREDIEAALTEEGPALVEEPSEAADVDATVDAAEATVLGLEEAEDEEEEFVPEIKRPGEEAISYLAGESFRVTHVGDMDSVGAASDVLESSLGGESGVLDEDWAHEHPAEEAAAAPAQEAADPEGSLENAEEAAAAPAQEAADPEGSLQNAEEAAAAPSQEAADPEGSVENAEEPALQEENADEVALPEKNVDAVAAPAAEPDVVEEASLEELPPGPSVDTASFAGLPEESVLSAETPVAEAVEAPTVARKASRPGVTFADEPQEAPVDIPAEHSLLASGAGEGDDELVDFSALDGEMND